MITAKEAADISITNSDQEFRKLEDAIKQQCSLGYRTLNYRLPTAHAREMSRVLETLGYRIQPILVGDGIAIFWQVA